MQNSSSPDEIEIVLTLSRAQFNALNQSARICGETDPSAYVEAALKDFADDIQAAQEGLRKSYYDETTQQMYLIEESPALAFARTSPPLPEEEAPTPAKARLSLVPKT